MRTINKKLLLSLFGITFLILLGAGLVRADLCRGYSGYYNDCNNLNYGYGAPIAIGYGAYGGYGGYGGGLGYGAPIALGYAGGYGGYRGYGYNNIGFRNIGYGGYRGYGGRQVNINRNVVRIRQNRRTGRIVYRQRSVNINRGYNRRGYGGYGYGNTIRLGGYGYGGGYGGYGYRAPVLRKSYFQPQFSGGYGGYGGGWGGYGGYGYGGYF